MLKTIKIKCLIKGRVEVEHPILFDNENVHIKVEYPEGFESWLKYIDFKIGTYQENVVQPAITLDHVTSFNQAGTVYIQPYSTKEWLDMKWETVSVPIKKSLLPL
jgi:hypothetical protein